MQPIRAVLRGGQQILRAYKPKIQASKPKNNLDFAADALVVTGALSPFRKKQDMTIYVLVADSCWLGRRLRDIFESESQGGFNS